MSNEKSIEELLELAKLPSDKQGEEIILNDVEHFISDCKIEAGNGKKAERVRGLLIYRAYKNWCKVKNKEPIYKDWFFRTFIKYFKRRMIRTYIKNNLKGHEKFYHIKINEHFQFTKEEIREEEILLRDSKQKSKTRIKIRASIKERKRREKKEKRSEKSRPKQT